MQLAVHASHRRVTPPHQRPFRAGEVRLQDASVLQASHRRVVFRGRAQVCRRTRGEGEDGMEDRGGGKLAGHGRHARARRADEPLQVDLHARGLRPDRGHVSAGGEQSELVTLRGAGAGGRITDVTDRAAGQHREGGDDRCLQGRQP